LRRFGAWLFEQRPPRASPAGTLTDDAAPAPGSKPRPRPYAGAPRHFDQTPAAPAPGPSERAPERGSERGSHRAETDEPRRSAWPRGTRPLLRTAAVVLVAVVAALLLRAFVVESFYVPSESMEPTLHGCSGCNNDHVLVEKLSYHFHDPQPGDVVVFHRPANWRVPDHVLIKRVIGVSGDVITLKNGVVYRNNRRLDEPYVNQRCRRGTTTRTGSTATTAYPKIPNGAMFVMGDNRCDSEDSRYFGRVPTDAVIGRAFMIVWPLDRIHSL
jgi:signal peptidase I